MNPLQQARDRLGPARDGAVRAAGRVKGAGARLVGRAKVEPRLGAALIIGLLLFVTWIAWTVYVWSENGANAGLGVLISWPAVLAVLALIASPFVGAGILIKRMAANGGPSLAIAGGGTTEPAEEEAAAAESDDAAAEEDGAEGEAEAEDEEPAGEGGGNSGEEGSESAEKDD